MPIPTEKKRRDMLDAYTGWQNSCLALMTASGKGPATELSYWVQPVLEEEENDLRMEV